MEYINLYDKYEIIRNSKTFELNVQKDGKECGELIDNDLVHLMFLRIIELERKEEVCKQQHTRFSRNGYSVNKVSAFGVGYIGDGKYETSTDENGRTSTHYIKWRSMLSRCYDPKTQLLHPTYIGCTVSDEWLNFQNFAKWYDNNIYEFNNETLQLDKDILVKHNRIYSPETCLLVPANINRLFKMRDKNKKNTPTGVSYVKRTNMYSANCKQNGRAKYLGGFKTPEEAFYAYKVYKEKIIKEVAEEYKSKIPDRLYKAMCDYEVNISD